MLSNSWRSLEIRFKWTKHCVLAQAGADNANANNVHITFTIKDTKRYIPVVTLSAKDYQKLSKFPSKDFERSVYRNECTKKCENKNTKNGFRYFLESNFVVVNRLFLLIYSNQDDNVKRYKARRYYSPIGIIKNCSVIINGKNFYHQLIDTDIKRYEKIIKLTTGQDEDYTTGCLLDYDYFKNHYRQISVD